MVSNCEFVTFPLVSWAMCDLIVSIPDLCTLTYFKYVLLLHDNAPAYKARIVTVILESEKVTVLAYPPCLPDLVPCNHFSLRNLNIIYLEGDTIREMPLDLLFISD